MFAWLNGTETAPPAFLEFRSSKWLIISTVAAAIFTDVFLYGIIVPVLPFALSGRAGIPEDEVQSMISVLLAVYGGALLVGAPIVGWVADRLNSRRWSFMAGLLALAGSTIFLVVGNSLALIIVGRILQGLSAAVVWVVGLALLHDTVGSEAIGKAMGHVGIAMSLAYMLGPLLGGIVFKRFVISMVRSKHINTYTFSQCRICCRLRNGFRALGRRRNPQTYNDREIGRREMGSRST
jgi:MFS family permease